jgi:hypothetical protein
MTPMRRAACSRHNGGWEQAICRLPYRSMGLGERSATGHWLPKKWPEVTWLGRRNYSHRVCWQADLVGGHEAQKREYLPQILEQTGSLIPLH